VARTGLRLRPGRYLDWWSRNHDATIPHAIAQLEASGTIDNFRRLVGESQAPYRGMVFQDSDLYKVLEGVAWTLGRQDDSTLQTFFDDMVELLRRAQRPDGYLNSNYQRPDRTQEPWTDFGRGHELYCLGHLLQAALAASRAMADDRLLDIATKNVDLVVRRFGGAEMTTALPGHPEIETALVELSRHTGDARYRDLAAAFVDRRGRGVFADQMFGVQYYQDDTPVRTTSIMRGHAVRALYLNVGVTDLYLETGEEALLEAIRAQWRDLVAHRMYLTGGTGSRHRDEAFGDAYELPSDRAYAETCAGIALVQWAWRMFLATGEAAVLDEFERALHNVVVSGISADGRAFFYSNPLQRRLDHGLSQEESAGRRLPWYSCACCPPNLTRTFASIENYVVAAADDDIRVGVYAAVEAEVAGVRLTIDTDYPRDGRVRIAVAGSSDAALRLRLPGWSHGRYRLQVNGRDATARVEEGWLMLDGVLRDGVLIDLWLPMEPRVVSAHPAVDAVRGSVAVTRGPVVYCAEQADNVAPVDRVALEPTAELRLATGDGDPLIHAPAVLDTRDPGTLPLYGSPTSSPHPDAEPTTLVLRPYATWGNGPSLGAMRVWLPRASRVE
jgi:DUF1680 family protein